MKIVKSKLSIAVLSLGFVSVIGAVAYATLARPASPMAVRKTISSTPVSLKLAATVKKAAPAKVAAKATAPHQQEIEAYLDQVRSFMQTPPRDGVFGSERVPTLHGKESVDLESYEAIRNLEGNLSLRSVVLGLQPNTSYPDSDKPVVVNGAWQISDKIDSIRLSDIHLVNPDRDDSEAATDRFMNQTDALMQFAIDIRKKGVEEDVKPVTVNGKQSWIVAKAIHASVNSCYKCHGNIKKGEPIGYVAALVSEAK